jgi:glycosyltransferase involved in cell wall biosynthesis
MPSAHESWGRVGVEAMTSGIPVIAAPTAGLKESLGDAGVFCDRDDLDAWEQALRRLLDGRRWKAASRKAKARAAELDPAADLDRWCHEVETLARRRLRVRSRVAG